VCALHAGIVVWFQNDRIMWFSQLGSRGTVVYEIKFRTLDHSLNCA